MRLTLIALAALAAASAAPAAACGLTDCAEFAVADDSYPLGEQAMRPTLRAVVEARHGQGLSLAGFYNDPALALAGRYAPASYGYGEPRRHYGPQVIVSPYGHGRPSAYPDGHHVY
jgi:hypothetical protein